MKNISHPQKGCPIRRAVEIKWHQQMEQHGKACLPTSPSQTVPTARDKSILRHAALFLVFSTLPVTSCSSERSFSNLKRIKTYLRSTCGNERLTSLALMHIHFSSQIWDPAFQTCRNLKLIVFFIHFERFNYFTKDGIVRGLQLLVSSNGGGG